MTDDTTLPFWFPAVRGKKLTAAFDGGRLSSDGGVMLLAAAFVEAFWSSIRGTPSSIKLLVGVALWVGMFGYFVAAGRGHGSRAD